MNRTAIIRCIVLLLMCLLSVRSCLAAQAADGQDATDDNARDAAANPRWHKIAWPWKTDPDLLAKRNEAIEELRQFGHVQIDNLRSERINWLVRGFEGTPNDEILKRTLPFTPELRRIEMNPKLLSVEGYTQLPQLQYLEYLFLNADYGAQAAPVDIDRKELACISRIPALRTLAIHACDVTDDELEALEGLTTLKGFGIQNTGLSAKCFRTIAKWPEIESISCTKEAFDTPIDRETYRAIASLDGRVKSLYFGEWDSMALHPSMIPAIAEIKSISRLWIGDVSHMTAAQLEPLGTLPNVTSLNYECAREKEHRAIFSQIRRNAAESLRKKKEAEEAAP